MDVKHMSKYAAKKARQAEMAQKTFAAINLAVRITNGTATPPKPKKPKQPPPPPRGLVNDLGTMPDDLADALEAAAENLRRANEIAAAALVASAKGLQTAEPRALESMTLVMADKAANAAKRARKIPNRRESPEGGVQSQVPLNGEAEAVRNAVGREAVSQEGT